MKSPKFISQPWKNDSAVLHVALMIIAAAVVWGLTCGLWSLSGLTETYYVGAAKKILASEGSLFANGSGYIEQNPPLYFWLTAGVLKITGEIQSFAPRLISVFFALLAMLCTYFCGRRLLSPKAGLYSAFILATFPVFMLAATKAAPNMLFTGLITISLTAIVTLRPHVRAGIIRSVFIWLAFIAAFLALGPLGPVMILIFIVLYAIAQGKHLPEEIRSIRLFSGIVAGIVVVGFWLFLEYHFTGSTFIQKEFGQLKQLYAGGIDAKGWWYYFANIGSILGIWVIGLLMALVMLLTHKCTFIPKWYVWLFWFAPGFILLCLLPAQNIDYILPLLPPLALFIGYYLSTIELVPLAGKISGLIAGMAAKIFLILGILLCTAALIIFIQPEFAWERAFYINQTGLVVSLIVGLVLILLSSWKFKNGFGVLFGAVVLALFLANLELNAAVRPALDVKQSSRYFSQNLQQIYPELEYDGLAAVNTAVDADAAFHNAGANLYHLYGKYQVRSLAFSPDMFANNDTLNLPDFILMAETDFNRLVFKPQLGGFAPVFWDSFPDDVTLILLKRYTDQITNPALPMPLVYKVPKPLLIIGTPPLTLQGNNSEDNQLPAGEEDSEAILKELYGGDVADDPKEIEGSRLPEPQESFIEIPNEMQSPVFPGQLEPAASHGIPSVLTDTSGDAISPKEKAADDPLETFIPTTEIEPSAADDDVVETMTESAINKPDETANEVLIVTPVEKTPVTVDTAVQRPPAEIPQTEDDEPDAATQAEPPINSESMATEDIEEIITEPPVQDLPDIGSPTLETESAPIHLETTPSPPAPVIELIVEPVTSNNSITSLLGLGTARANELVRPEMVPNLEVISDDPLPLQQVAETLIPLEESYTVIKLQVPTENTQTAPVILNSAKCILTQGYVLTEDTLIGYQSNCGGRNNALLDVNTYQPNLVRFYSLNLQNGFKDNAYAMHWVKTQSAKFAAEYNMLIINNLSDEQVSMPFNQGFNRWAFNQISQALNPQAIFFNSQQLYDSDVRQAVRNFGTELANDPMDLAEKIQINFGLLDTEMVFEFEQRPPLIMELLP